MTPGRRRAGAVDASRRSGRSPTAAADMFYGRLFEIAPEVRPLFQGDMAEQGRKLMATLAVVVGSLHSLPTILPAVERAGEEARRATASKPTITRRSARRCCGRWSAGSAPAWTPQVAAAWTEAYTTLSDFMIGEAYGRSLAAAVA